MALVLLALVVLIGGGRRLLQAMRTRRVVARLGDPDVTPLEVEAAGGHGRAALIDLFTVLGKANDPAMRDAAGHALAALWAQDHLIAEEERAIVTRGFDVAWKGRRRYPRSLSVPIPIQVQFGVPFLRDQAGEVGPSNLEWSYRLAGARRASLETDSPWTPGPGLAEFTIDPGDFPTNGPHRLVLQARARTRGLTSHWELPLPHMLWTFEFDPILTVDALLTHLDDARAQTIASSVRLTPPTPDTASPRFLPLNPEFSLRNPPDLIVTTPLPCDLAHTLSVEFDGVPASFPAGSIVLGGQGTATEEPSRDHVFPLGPIAHVGPETFERPGDHRLRVVLQVDAQLGWTDPDVRAVWPGTITTDWLPVQIVRS